MTKRFKVGEKFKLTRDVDFAKFNIYVMPKGTEFIVVEDIASSEYLVRRISNHRLYAIDSRIIDQHAVLVPELKPMVKQESLLKLNFAPVLKDYLADQLKRASVLRQPIE